MRALWLLPSIDPEWGDACQSSLRVPFVLRVDNSGPGRNLGVPASWNIGARAARGGGFDYLVVCSEACRFGPAGGLDFEEKLTGSPMVLSMCVGFHLVALSVGALERTGEFDENLTPGYGEDRDYLIRLHLAGLPSPGYNDLRVPQHQVDVTEAGVAHSLSAGLVEVSFARMTRYLDEKWGATAPGEHYPNPYNDPSRDWRFWRPRAG